MTTDARSGFPTDSSAAAELYLARGLAPIPLPSRSKDPGYAGWRDLRLKPDTLDTHFPPQQSKNLGILNGSPSGDHLDVDLDCPEAVLAAPLLLPATGWVFGRMSALGSHRIYHADRSLDTAQDPYRDLDGTMLVELRGTGGLTVYPPSTHKDTGERIAWDHYEDPADVTLIDLRWAVREVAACALLARHWPAKGSRQDAALALSGGLMRGGWEQERTARFILALATATGDEEPGKRAEAAAATAKKREGKGNTTGWPRLAELLGEKGPQIVGRVRDWLGLTAAAEARDLPIPEPPPWPRPPEAEAYHGLAGRIVRTIEPASEADPAALLVQALIGVGNVVGRSAHYIVEADRHHANEFAVMVGRTSKARKGTSWGHVHRLLREAEEQWATEHVQTGASSGEGIIWAVRDPITKRERTKEGKEIKYVEVEADPGIADKRLLVYEPEYANVLKQTERQGNTLSAIFRQAWDGGDLRTLTKNSPARARGAHVSLIGHITAEELRRYLTLTETANGFGNRHLWICTGRSKQLPDGGRVDRGAWDGLRSDLVEVLAFAGGAGGMARDDQARGIWREVYGELSEGKPGLAGALLARAEAHVLRLSMLYALMDRSTVIQAPHLLAGLALWEYAERSVLHIFGDSLGDAIADEVLRLLRSSPNGLTRNDIMNFLGRHQSSDRIGRALGLLFQHHLVRHETQETGGRPAERWFAVTRGRVNP